MGVKALPPLLIFQRQPEQSVKEEGRPDDPGIPQTQHLSGGSPSLPCPGLYSSERHLADKPSALHPWTTHLIHCSPLLSLPLAQLPHPQTLLFTPRSPHIFLSPGFSVSISLLSHTAWTAPFTLFWQPTQPSVHLVHAGASPPTSPYLLPDSLVKLRQ